LLGERFGALVNLRVERLIGPGGCDRFVLEHVELREAFGGIGDRCGRLEVSQNVRRLAVGHAGWFSAWVVRPWRPDPDVARGASTTWPYSTVEARSRFFERALAIASRAWLHVLGRA